MTRQPKSAAGESGQALLLVIVSLSLFLLGALGFAIDGAQLYAQRQMAQTAADAAAQAAIMSIFFGTNATAPSPFATGSPPSSFTCTTTDSRTPCVYAALNGFGKTASDTVTITFPTTIAGVPLSSTSIPAVSVSVQRTVRGGLIRMLGASSTVVKARATAGITQGVPSSCIYALNPNAKDAFLANGNISVTLNCGIAVASNDPKGGEIKGSAVVNATSIQGNIGISGGATATPAPTPLFRPPVDPFASLPAPAVAASCDAAHTNYTVGAGTWTPSPGTYCGGMSIGSQAIVNFNPGIYVIKGGTFNINAGATVNGSGVMFYLTGTNGSYGSVGINGGATVTLSAPSSGTYMGVLFFQDRAIRSNVTANINGGANLHLSGSLYFPTTPVSVSGGAAGATWAIIADTVSFSGNATFTFDPSGTQTGLNVQSVALLE